MAKVLILSGGGAKGAFTIGALTVLQQRRGTLDFNIISGTSTGSLIAALLAANRLDLLRQIYLDVDNSDIVNFQNLIANMRNGVPYIMSDAPLRTIIHREITPAVATAILTSTVTLLLTAVSLQTGKIIVFSNKDIRPRADSKYTFVQMTNREQLLNALSASSNQFAFLQPIPMKVGGSAPEQLVDGGVRDTIPSRPVFEVDLNPDEIVVLSNNPLELFPVSLNYTGALEILMRGISIFIQDVRENDLRAIEEWKQRTGNAVLFIQPDTDLDQEYPTGLRFERQRMARMMVQGERKATLELDALASAPTARRSMAGRKAVRPTAKKKSKPQPKPKAKPKATDHRCKGKTQEGKRCKNMAKGRSVYCHLHGRA